MNFISTVFVQRTSYLPIPMEYTIQTEISSSFHSTYLTRSQIFENFPKSPFFTHTFFSQHLKSLISGVITMPQKIEWVAPKALHMGQFIRHDSIFEKIFSKACFENCEKIRCLPFHTSSRYKKYIFTLFVRQSCREKYNLPFFILVNEYFFVRIEKNKNFCEKNNFESDFFHT